jgi:hypothetical protein
MLAKVLIGVLAVGAVAGGGLGYMRISHGCCPLTGNAIGECPTTSQPVSTQEIPPCCQQPSRADYPSTEVNCCQDVEPATEVLAIPPREVK